MSKGYNGWSNYETWRMNLEMFGDSTPEDMGVYITDIAERDEYINALANGLESLACELIEEQATGFALDLANSFLARVDWTEIAEHMVDDAIAELV
jgi:hypothetical protein